MAQSTTSGTSSRRYIREHEVPSTSRYMDSEWESKEALRQRELEEARARAAQMEKTMRWWSDCTANWREKWSKVRNERNAARDEAKALRAKLEIAVKDANTFKHESQELELQNEQLKKEMEKIHMILLKHAGQFDQQIFTILESDSQLRATLGLDEQLEFYSNIESNDTLNTQRNLLSCKTLHEASDVASGGHNILPERDIEEYVLQGAVPKHAVELYKESANSLDQNITKLVADSNPKKDSLDKQQLSLDTYNKESLTQKMSTLQLKLEEATKTISVEREEKDSLHCTVEKLKAELKQLREQCEELSESRADTMRELSELKERFQLELNDEHIADLIDDTGNGEGMDRRLSELRTELERLQVENAAEWSKRERLETEKISLERENKLLRLKLYELQEKMESRRPRPVSTADTDTRQLQHEILVRNMVLLEVKQYQAALKQSLAEKTTELSHAMRRSEQYEAEVKRVRTRVEELKKELAAAQDEVDAATGSVRKLQRTNEDLMEQLESANVQLEHFRNSKSESCAAETDAEGAGEQKFQINNSDEYAEVYDRQQA